MRERYESHPADNKYQINAWIPVSMMRHTFTDQAVSLETVKDGNSFASMESSEKPVSLSGSSVSASRLIYRSNNTMVVATINAKGSTGTTVQLWKMNKPFNKKIAG